MSLNKMRARVPVCKHGDKSFVSDVLLSDLCKLENALSFDLQFSSGFR